MMISIDKAFGIHEKALPLFAKRMEVLANNISNQDTPNYKAQDIDFEAVLKRANQGQQFKKVKVLSTAGTHIQPDKASSDYDIKYVTAATPSLDGNTVDPHQAKTAYAENSMRYQISLNFLNGKIRGLMSAIRGE